jgi:hypothetical protein
MAATVPDTRDLRPPLRTNRHAHHPSRWQVKLLTSPTREGGPPYPRRRRILFGEGHRSSGSTMAPLSLPTIARNTLRYSLACANMS